MRKKIRNAIIAAVMALVVLMPTPASSHTAGGQTIHTAAYKPNAVSGFAGRAWTDCNNGSYGQHTGGCITSLRAIKLAYGERKCTNWNGNTCTAFTNWVYSADAVAYCEPDLSASHCARYDLNAQLIDDYCAIVNHQYRTRAKGGYKGASGTWYWDSYVYSPAAWGLECGA